MNSRPAFNLRVAACRELVQRELKRDKYWKSWLAFLVLSDTKERSCEKTK